MRIVRLAVPLCFAATYSSSFCASSSIVQLLCCNMHTRATSGCRRLQYYMAFAYLLGLLNIQSILQRHHNAIMPCYVQHSHCIPPTTHHQVLPQYITFIRFHVGAPHSPPSYTWIHSIHLLALSACSLTVCAWSIIRASAQQAVYRSQLQPDMHVHRHRARSA